MALYCVWVDVESAVRNGVGLMAERFKQQLAVIVVVIIGAIFAGPNALQTSSSASPNINGGGELRE